jgi:hypothetical protein
LGLQASAPDVRFYLVAWGMVFLPSSYGLMLLIIKTCRVGLITTIDGNISSVHGRNLTSI